MNRTRPRKPAKKAPPKRATRKFVDTDNTVSKQNRLRGLKPFRPGQSGNPAGRPKGSRNKLSEAFLRDFCALWEELGDMALRRVAFEDPSTFVRAAVALIPKHHELSGAEGGPHIVEVRWKDNEAPVEKPIGSTISGGEGMTRPSCFEQATSSSSPVGS